MPASGMRGLNDALDMCVGVANGRTGTPTLLVNEWLLETSTVVDSDPNPHGPSRSLKGLVITACHTTDGSKATYKYTIHWIMPDLWEQDGCPTA